MRHAAAVSALLLCSALTLAERQPTAPPGIPEAARIMAKDPAAAAVILEGVTSREPANARAWRLLASARQQAKLFDEAIQAYQKAIALGPDPVSTYNIGVVHALKGETDRALEWLGKAKAARADMTGIELDPNLASLRTHPRLKTLLPAADDFANPFVEPTRIQQEWRGEAANDQFGWVARAIGDVDKDGVIDFTTSAPTHATVGPSAGRIYVYSTKRRALLWKADGAAGDRLGHTIEAAGDTNRDGIPDVVASGGGKVRVFSGRDGAVLRVLSSPGSMPLWSTAGAGDVNQDGYADIMAGSTFSPGVRLLGKGRQRADDDDGGA
jgi:hypothetical protein